MNYLRNLKTSVKVKISSQVLEHLDTLTDDLAVMPEFKKVDFDEYLVTPEEYSKFYDFLLLPKLTREDRIAIKTVLNSIHKVVLSDIFTYTYVDSFFDNEENNDFLYQIYSEKYDEYYEHMSFEAFYSYEEAQSLLKKAQGEDQSYGWKLMKVKYNDIENISILY